MKRLSECKTLRGFLSFAVLLTLVVSAPLLLVAQELPDSVEGSVEDPTAKAPGAEAPSLLEDEATAARAPSVLSTEDPAAFALSRTFRGLSLGMEYAALMDALTADELFAFRGERDVSLLPHRDQSLVEARGRSFIRHAWFQLQSGSLFIMAFSLSADHLDHYSVFTRLVERYGEPKTLNPRMAVWEDNDTRIALERPLTVKYLDLATLNGLLEDSTVKEADITRLRQDFLDDF